MRTAGFTGRLAERIIYQDTDKGVLEMDFLTLEQSVWPRLQEEKRPIVLYGMGDGADKILRQFERLGIQAAAVFASDEFVRGHSFRGFRVHRLD